MRKSIKDQSIIWNKWFELENMEDMVDLSFWWKSQTISNWPNFLSHYVRPKILECEFGTRSIDHMWGTDIP
jgi:hypothetical protein